MLRPLAFAAVLCATVAAAGPSYALSCYGAGSFSGPARFSAEFGFGFGRPMGEEERMEFYRQDLVRKGIRADRVEMWNGCLRAYVRKPGGGMEMQFFHPGTLERVQ